MLAKEYRRETHEAMDARGSSAGDRHGAGVLRQWRGFGWWHLQRARADASPAPFAPASAAADRRKELHPSRGGQGDDRYRAAAGEMRQPVQHARGSQRRRMG